MRNKDKSKLLRSGSKSGISSLKGASENVRTFLNGNWKAKRVVIPSRDIESKTDIHPLNPRNQDALTIEAVRDIYSSIIKNGVNQEGIAVRCKSTGRLMLLDASRRRFVCLQAEVELPLWELIGDVSDEDILAIINDSQEVKRWSYPEHAQYLFRIARRKGIDVDTAKLEDLASALSIGRESLRKRIAANNVVLPLRQVFVDFEGIPNSYYSDLIKLQRDLEKNHVDIADSMKSFSKVLQFPVDCMSITDRQKITLEQLKLFIAESLNVKTKPKEWKKESLASFDKKGSYATLSQSPDRNKMKIELARIGADKEKQILEFIKSILNT